MFVQPQIVAVGEGYELDKLYIVCEGSALCSIPQSIVDSMIALLSSFYILNTEYRKSKAILCFLETPYDRLCPISYQLGWKVTCLEEKKNLKE